MFRDVPGHFNFAHMESETLEFWETHDIFHKSLRQREGKPTFVFYEGPPTANGLPHNGHVLTRVIKDLFPRYKTMQGYYVPRKAGWDTHGLPVETEVEKELGIRGREAIQEYGLEKFNRKCIESVFRYTDAWEQITKRIGFWIDLPDAYVTYHKSYVESVWWALSRLFKKGLLYEGYKIIWWWAQGGTALSTAEVGWGYKETADPSVYVKCPVEDEDNLSLLVWTTTPWTLFDNMYVAVKPDFDYAYVRDGNETIIMAAARVDAIAQSTQKELNVIKTVKGTELAGLRYVPPFDYHYSQYGNDTKILNSGGEDYPYWRVIEADFVTLDTGTGLVHQAPAFGEVDFDVFKAQSARFRDDLDLFCSVKPNGTIADVFPEVAGQWVKDADKTIIRLMKDNGVLYYREQYIHNYPYCWRAETDPLIQYPRKGWFIRTTAEIDRAIENNQHVGWLPEHIKDGRFGDFLKNNVDWALSRERFWGTPLNIWRCDTCGAIHAPESVAEIEYMNPGAFKKFHEAKKNDPSLTEHLMVHRPWIDDVKLPCVRTGCGGTMTRVPDVIDCWFDSGSMPFAQWGFPHAEGSLEKFKAAFPADFISEAIDQTRGWFYSLLMISTLLFDEETQKEYGIEPVRDYPHPYKNCIVLGHVCDMEGKKESKSKGNYTSPDVVLMGYLTFAIAEQKDGKEPGPGEAFLMPELIKSLELSSRERVLLRPEHEALRLDMTSPMLHTQLKPGAAPKDSIILNPNDRKKLNLNVGDKVRVEMPFDPPGADAFRWLFYSSNPPWNSTRNSLRNIRDGQKEFLIKLRNVYSFFVIYANIDGFNPAEDLDEMLRDSDTVILRCPLCGKRVEAPAEAVRRGEYPNCDGCGSLWLRKRAPAERAEMDRWILSEMNIMLKDVIDSLNRYRVYDAALMLNAFVESLSNWYLRRSRARYWAPGFNQDKYDAFQTLYDALTTLAKAAAPFVPFVSEEIYQNLIRIPYPGDASPESVHLCDYPVVDESAIDTALSERMALARAIAALGLSARASKKIKVRQPLASAQVILADPGRKTTLTNLLDIIKDELNVKTIGFPDDPTEYVSYTVKPNFPAIGPKYGRLVPAIKKALSVADPSDLKAELDAKGTVSIDAGTERITLTSDEIAVGLEAKGRYVAASGQGVVVVLDTDITDELKEEGLARELINRIQTARKDLGLEFSDKIRASVTGSESLATVIRHHYDYITGETLCEKLDTDTPVNNSPREVTIDGESAILCLMKVDGALPSAGHEN